MSGDDAAADFLAIRYFLPGFRPRPEVGRARSYHANISVGSMKIFQTGILESACPSIQSICCPSEVCVMYYLYDILLFPFICFV